MTSQPAGGRATNRLAHESSPYLRQHMHNPVDWYPWGEEALERARAEDRPIFLSVGYSTCHWCHVMAHESFESEAVARYLNAHFVSVKLDREERPDIDAVYMRAVQAMTGAGGWPMSVFLTPDLRPFYAVTYLPPNDAHGLPSFGRVLASVVRAWSEQRESLEHNAGVLTEAVQEGARPPRGAGLPDRARALENIAGMHDARHGGFGGAPKFPAPTLLQYLLTEERTRPLALHTLDAMARSGLYDQLGGGYHRYSVDAAFAVPHFEKMLYDNAQLVSAHLLAWRYGGGAAHANTARDILTYLEREMRAPGGGYFAAQDADSGGIEGQFFVWTPSEVREALAAAGLEEHTAEALDLFAVTKAGNFRDPHHPAFGSRSVLQRRGDPPRYAALRAALFAAREAREKPHTDRKVLTGWNGLTLSALADAALAFPGEGHLERARALMDFVEGTMTPGGVLHHSLGEGDAAPRVTGLLEDHALYGLGLLALHAAGGGEAPLLRAHALWNTVQREFWDADAGVFYSSAEGAGTPLARQAEGFDAAVLSDNAAAARLGLLLARHGLAPEGEEIARAVLQSFGGQMQAAPQGFGGLWAAQAMLEESASEIALLRGGRSDELLATLGRTPLPRTVLSVLDEGSALPLGLGRRAGELYLCRNHACTAPLGDPDGLPERLQAELGVSPLARG